jgi:methionyl aminopeptidase
MIIIKSRREIEAMREAGRVAALVLEAVGQALRPGMRTRELDALAAEVMREHGASSADYGYQPDPRVPPYPASICVSVNEEVIHGVPGSRRLAEGDLVGVDVTVRRKGYIGDAARTFPVGEVGPEARQLLEVTEHALQVGIAECWPGHHLSDVSAAIEAVARRARYGIVRTYCGHGVGRSMHEEPEVPNFGRPGHGPVLEVGMTFAVEPMFNLGTSDVVVDRRDGWTVRTKDGSLSAHFEHTVAIGEDGPQLLTLP